LHTKNSPGAVLNHIPSEARNPSVEIKNNHFSRPWIFAR
jgi:hypothetical protein